VSATEGATPIRKTTPADREAVVRVLARAFEVEPFARYALRKDEHRERAFKDVFDIAFCQLTQPHDENWIAGDGDGAALWTPPGKWQVARALTRVHRLIGCAGVTRIPHILGVLNRVDQGHPTKPPHFYLFALGVDPSKQGRGIGSALLKASFERIDAANAPAYLETSLEANRRLYERHGFRVQKELQLGGGAPVVWHMWREARGVTPAG
jgi:ribosomal protein S18 acetylase RimI-like enzyme